MSALVPQSYGAGRLFVSEECRRKRNKVMCRDRPGISDIDTTPGVSYLCHTEPTESHSHPEAGPFG